MATRDRIIMLVQFAVAALAFVIIVGALCALTLYIGGLWR